MNVNPKTNQTKKWNLVTQDYAPNSIQGPYIQAQMLFITSYTWSLLSFRLCQPLVSNVCIGKGTASKLGKCSQIV
jgi:hypothetical protein